MKTITWMPLAIAASMMSLQGCSSLNIGEEEFYCDELGHGEVTDDVICDGPRQVYQVTNSYKNLKEYRQAHEDDELFADESLQAKENEIPRERKINPGRSRTVAVSANDTSTAQLRDQEWYLTHFNAIQKAALDEPTPAHIQQYQRALAYRNLSGQGAGTNAATDPVLGYQSNYAPSVTTTYKPIDGNKIHDPNTPQPAQPIAQFGQSVSQQTNPLPRIQQCANSPTNVAPEPLAILMPPRVMRILVASWKDSSGDLNMPGYIFVNIAKETWLVGDDANDRPNRITPLVIQEDATQNQAIKSRQTQGVDGLGVNHQAQPNMSKQ